jgi:exopolyphosphatase/guanosine-5'-triphosphate,3'-diphosphate pyrophosphatase
MNKNIAIIDLGSNLTKLVITSPSLPLRVLHRSVYDTKTLKSAPKGYFDDQSISRIESDIQDLLKKCNEYDCTTYLGIATSAFRTRKNGLAVIQHLNQKFNLHIEIISGNREAGLIYKGALASVQTKLFPTLIMDIGGGSTELIIANQKNILWKHSFDFGSTALTQNLNLNGPLSPQNITDLNSKLDTLLSDLPAILNQYHPISFIGTTGAFESFAEIIENAKEVPSIVDSNYKYAIADLRLVINTLINSSIEERLKLKGLNPLRSPTAHIAAIILKYILNHYDFQQHILSLGDVKEGLAQEFIENEL